MKTNSWLVGLALLFLLSPNSLKASGASDLTLPTGYKVVQVLISKDDFVSAKSAAENLAVAVQRWIDEKGTSDPQYPNVSQMRSGLDGIKLSKSDEELRTSFGLLSKGVVQFIQADMSLQSGWQLFFCPMTSDYGYWIQTSNEKITNPYMGAAMLSCGSKKKWNLRAIF